MPVDEVPLRKMPEAVAGMPCYYIYLNPNAIEFNLAVGRRDVLQIRFQLRQLTDNAGIQAQLKKQVLDFASRFMKTVHVELSEAEQKFLAPQAALES